MDLPDQDTAIHWEGAAVVDRAGEQLGRCTGVFADVDTDAIEWITVSVDDHRRLFIPALDATESGGAVRVSFARGDVLAAPRVGDEQELSKADEVRLYEHYGVAHTSAATGSVLPAGVTTPSSDSSSAEPSLAQVTALEDVPAPVATTALRPPPPPEPVVEPDEPVVHLVEPAPEPAPVSTPPVRTTVEPAPSPASPARPPLRAAPKPPPRAGASGAAPLAVVAGIVAAVGVVLQAWELRARRRRRPAARAGRASKQAKASSTAAVRTAAKQLTDANAAAARTTRQLAEAASSATTSAARSGSAVTSSVTAIPPAVARRGRRARRSVTGGLWDLATVGATGTGYVLGAKAGRGRYEQISQQAREVASAPQVTAVIDAVTHQPSTSGPAGR